MKAKYLVIVESPAKAKTINKILGKDYLVKASMGHVRDLPEKALGVDVEHGFEPRYEAIKGRGKVVADLKAAADGAERVYLAPDPDREGEAIAWHLKEMLKGKVPGDRFSRVTYNEITAPAIRAAFAHPGEINMRRVDSQQARRILDRVVGYKVSPHLWQRIHGARSAGRVQSVALRLVCEREAEIRAFKPEPYWVVGVKAAKRAAGAAPFAARLWRVAGKKADVRDEGRAKALMAELEKRGLRVKDVLTREASKHAPPPFITSSLQQAASGALGFSPSRTMRIAQKLYEGVSVDGGAATGLITYMRTDSTAVAATAQEAARRVIASRYGEEFLPARPNVYKNRSSAQEAHEAIRPTDPARLPDQVKDALDPDEHKLYTLIWRRFMASQMAPARIGLRTAELEAVRKEVLAGGAVAAADPREAAAARAECLFRVTASEILFPGFMRASGLEKKRKGEDESDEGELADSLPELAAGEELDVLQWLSERKETQPPPRYTEAALVKALEENGVGRPSTYAQTISTLLDREYVTREKRALVPSELGWKVNEFLVSNLDELFAVPFTAKMEAELDKIEDGGVAWRDMLADFYRHFTAWMGAMKGPEAPREDIAARLEALEAVKEWSAPVKRGNRTYSDEKFVASIRRQYDEGDRPFTDRQKLALDRVLLRHAAQIPGAEALFARLGVKPGDAADGGERGAAAAAAAAAPDPGVAEKIKLLGGVEFDPPHAAGKRKYDDKAFFESLRDQAAAGRTLSPRQVACLDRMLVRYASQLPSGAAPAPAGESAVPAPDPEEARRADEILRWMESVGEWKPAVTRKGRTYDDREFFQSLKTQREKGKTLSPRQLGALRRLAKGYLSQLPPEAAAALGTARGRE